MKNIKSWSLITFVALLLTSCIVKSLHAFYTKDLISYEPQLIGNWINTDGRSLNFEPFKDFYVKVAEALDSKVDEENMKEIDSAFNVHHFNKSYGVTYVRNQDSSWFQAMPFKINNQLFLDFTLAFDLGIYDNAQDLREMHLTKVHTLAKVDLTSNNSVSIKWLDEDKLDALIKENRIKIKHERDEIDDKFLLTASSEELVKFIAKYMKSEDSDNWKTDVEFNLVRK